MNLVVSKHRLLAVTEETILDAPEPPAISGTPDLFELWDKRQWVEKDTHLRFLVAGRRIKTSTLRALVLDRPLRPLDATSELPPPPRQFENGIEAARVNSCPMPRRVQPLKLLPNAIRYVPSQYRHSYVDLRGSFEEYLGKFSSKSRTTLKRKVRRFLEMAQIEQPFREFSRPEDMGEFHRLALEVSMGTYQHRLLQAGVSESEEFRKELAALAERDQVRGYMLMHGDRPVAYSLCVARGRTLMLQKTGFDPKYAPWSPGTVLVYLILQRLFAEQKFDVYDFGSGYFEWKGFFATGDLQCGDLIYARRTWANLTTVCAHFGVNILNETLKGLLDLIGLKAKVKKLIHKSS